MCRNRCFHPSESSPQKWPPLLSWNPRVQCFRVTNAPGRLVAHQGSRWSLAVMTFRWEGIYTDKILLKHNRKYCKRNVNYMGMDQYLLIPFLSGWTDEHPFTSYFGVHWVPGFWPIPICLWLCDMGNFQPLETGAMHSQGSLVALGSPATWAAGFVSPPTGSPASWGSDHHHREDPRHCRGRRLPGAHKPNCWDMLRYRMWPSSVGKIKRLKEHMRNY
jgi:hypothetical protein